MTFELTITLRELGISEETEQNCPLPRFSEPEHLVPVGNDMFGRPQQMTAEAHSAWLAMKAAALEDGIELQLVSAYRSIEYQCELIREKLASGRSLEDILSVNAIPGYSEHHTGCAVDLHDGDGPPLETSFEQQPAFRWLCKHATRFGFRMSFPKDNDSGITYEPWHWCYKGS